MKEKKQSDELNQRIQMLNDFIQTREETEIAIIGHIHS